MITAHVEQNISSSRGSVVTALPRHRLIGLAVALLGLIPLPATALNLTRLATFKPLNFELLDVEIAGDFAYIPAGLGGLNIIDISDPAAPQFIGEYFASGCEYGRIYAWHSVGNLLYGSGRYCGIKVLNVASPRNPSQLADYGSTGRSYEHAVSSGSFLYAAVHTEGVEIIDIANPQALQFAGLVPTTYAWALAASADGQLLFVADGAGGLKIIDISSPSAAQVVGIVATSGTAKDVAPAGNFVFVAVGASGVDMIDVSDPANPVLVANYNTSGYASRVAVSDSLVAVSDWDDVEVLAWNASPSLELVGQKDTGGRVMAINMVGHIIYSAEWRFFRTFRFGAVSGPDLDVSTRDLDFPHVDTGNCLERPLTIWNNGGQTLNLVGVEVNHADFDVSLSVGTIPPGEARAGSVTYCATSENGQGLLTLFTDDPGEPELSIKLDGNSTWGLEVGQMAPDFTLPSVNGFGDITLSLFRSRVVVLAFFASW